MLTQIRSQKQQFTVLPQQIQLLKLFHLTTVELQQRILEELNENPLLEENIAPDEYTDDAIKDTIQDYQDVDEYQYDDIPDYKLEHNNYLSDKDLPQRPIVEQYDFRKYLKEQITYVLESADEQDLADYFIDSVNESGLLELSLEQLADDYSFKKNRIVEIAEIEHIRALVMDLEPGGVGCFTIREFLLFQLRKMNLKRPDVKKAIFFLENYRNSFPYKNKETIADFWELDKDEIQIVLRLIRTCKSKPITITDSISAHAIIPDFILKLTNDVFEISLRHQRSATLFVNQSMISLIGKNNGNPDNQYLKSKLNSAQWFVEAIKQRERTMQKVMGVIVELQREFFINGDIEFLKPMILKNVADKIGVDISTISRITCNKYVDTHFGTILLKDLFSEGIENELGETISNRVIQSAMEAVIRNEDKKNPLTDTQLMNLLAIKGFNLARRTVAKYREQLRIPSAHLRAIWAS